jgi:NAD+ synthase (glutamine-hydrolysing)
VCVNGEVVAQASQFSMKDVEVITAVVDLDAVRSYRQDTASFQEQSSYETQLPTVDVRYFSLRHSKSASYDSLLESNVTAPIAVRIHAPEEECAMGPACWLWDYLRRSGASGYLLPLSGGADSAAVAAIVRVMCVMAADAALSGNTQVIADIRKLFANNGATSEVVDEVYARYTAAQLTSARVTAITTDSPQELTPVSSEIAEVNGSDEGIVEEPAENTEVMEKRTILANELCYQILHTVYLGTSNSSTNTLDRAKRLAGSIRSYHNSVVIDNIVSAVLNVFAAFTGKTPRFVSQGGSMAEDLALQNIQARLRMVMSYLCAQLFPWLRGNKGFLLVLSSGNVDEALRGYMTKYDCSSGDVNPIGGICKGDLKRMLVFLANKHKLPILDEIANAVPTVSCFDLKNSFYLAIVSNVSTISHLFFNSGGAQAHRGERRRVSGGVVISLCKSSGTCTFSREFALKWLHIPRIIACFICMVPRGT